MSSRAERALGAGSRAELSIGRSPPSAGSTIAKRAEAPSEPTPISRLIVARCASGASGGRSRCAFFFLRRRALGRRLLPTTAVDGPAASTTADGSSAEPIAQKGSSPLPTEENCSPWPPVTTDERYSSRSARGDCPSLVPGDDSCRSAAPLCSLSLRAIEASCGASCRSSEHSAPRRWVRLRATAGWSGPFESAVSITAMRPAHEEDIRAGR
eukprot:scaffold227668_cov27-Tisochrysis_lutea.AAC.1